MPGTCSNSNRSWFFRPQLQPNHTRRVIAKNIKEAVNAVISHQTMPRRRKSKPTKVLMRVYPQKGHSNFTVVHLTSFTRAKSQEILTDRDAKRTILKLSTIKTQFQGYKI